MLLSKKKFSGSTDGKRILVAATASPGTLIHTAKAGTADNTFDEIWIYAFNADSVARALTIEWGDTSGFILTLAAVSGLILVVPGLILQNSGVVRAYAAAINVVGVWGWVNDIAP